MTVNDLKLEGINEEGEGSKDREHLHESSSKK